MEFNLNEVLEIAKNIEKSGFAFYKQAAKQLSDYSDFFDYLAKEEIGHEKVFDNMKSEFISKESIDAVYDPDLIIPQYFDSLAGSTIFKKDMEMEELFKDVKSVEDVIDWAIKREHDTILFFIGLKSSLDDMNDKIVVEKIISEEINHVHILMNKKSELI